MELKLYMQMLRRGWWIVALTMLAALNLTLILDYFATPRYIANTRFIVSPNPNVINETDVVNSLEALDKRSIVVTYSEILNSRRVYQEALSELNLLILDMDDYLVATVVLPDANVLELTVTGTDPQLVAVLANTIGQLAINNISRLYRAYDISVLDPAIPPILPVSPVPLRDASLALVLSMVVGVALAIFSEQIRIPLETYRQRSRMDILAGVYNNQYFRKLLEDETILNPDSPPTIGIIELTGLQEMNQTLPPVALQLIREHARDVLRRELRGNDSIGRWNDISFVVMLPSTPGSAASRTFNRIYQSLKHPKELRQYDLTIYLDPHIGGAVFSSSMTTKELIDQAEAVLNKARQSAENPMFVWEMNNPFWLGKDGS
jgi:diguanylate cyclase (GGDEF)-like protein